jgi:hypothetical protein
MQAIILCERAQQLAAQLVVQQHNLWWQQARD